MSGLGLKIVRFQHAKPGFREGCASAGRECLPSLNETDMKPHKPSFVWAVVPVIVASLGKGTVLSRIFGQVVVAAGRYQQEGSD